MRWTRRWRHRRQESPCGFYHHVTMLGTLTICGTPIGNLSDLSSRAAETLSGADLIFAEDTRRTAKLLTHLGISVPMKSFFAGNERSRLDLLRSELLSGTSVVLVSDAGMPVISDPGASAVEVAIECGAAIGVVPGPSAVVTAIAVSGFEGDRFVFDGFLPRKGRARHIAITSMEHEGRTTVLFASPKRLAPDLEDLEAVLGPHRRIVVTRELTKVFEQIWRGSLADAATYWTTNGTTKGEFTLVVEGAKDREPSVPEAIKAARALLDEGASVSDAARSISRSHGVRRKDLYDSLIEAQ